MSTYIITFEINDSDRKVKVKEQIKLFGPYCPIHDNAWAIITEKKSAEIRDTLSKHLLPVDKMFVIRSGTESAWRNAYGEKNSVWLKTHL